MYVTGPMNTITDLANEYGKMPEDTRERFLGELPTLLAHAARWAQFNADMGLVMSADNIVWQDDGIDSVGTR